LNYFSLALVTQTA